MRPSARIQRSEERWRPTTGPPVTYDIYLQGSYQNDTNISGDSDVDVMLELKSTFYHDMEAGGEKACQERKNAHDSVSPLSSSGTRLCPRLRPLSSPPCRE